MAPARGLSSLLLKASTWSRQSVSCFSLSCFSHRAQLYLAEAHSGCGRRKWVLDPVGHQEMRDRLAATIVRYNALMGVYAATHQRADNMEYAKSRELKRARKRRSHRAVAGEGDAGHSIGA